MNRGGMGSASIVLVFAVLCLSIFTMISYISARAEESLINTEVDLVKNFYEADTLAVQILDNILSSGATPEEIFGVEITSYWDMDLWAERVSFIIPVSAINDLYVAVAISENLYEILTWRMYKTGEWEADDRLDVWQGSFDGDGFFSGW